MEFLFCSNNIKLCIICTNNYSNGLILWNSMAVCGFVDLVSISLVAICWARPVIELSIMSPRMKLWYLSHRRPAKAHESLRICTVLLEPSLFTHIKYGSRWRIRSKIRHLAKLDSCACAYFEECINGGRKVP